MKIAYDGKRALNNMTGLGNYSRLVIESIAEHYPTDTLEIFAPQPRQNPRTKNWCKYPNIRMYFPKQKGIRFGKALWRTFGITSDITSSGANIYHGLSNELPLNIQKAGIPTVVTIHDLIYRTMPECYKPIDRILYDFKYSQAARNATRIIAISECTKRDIIRFYGIEEERIEVIYQGCHPTFAPPATDFNANDVKNRLALPQRYIVQVGTIERRKNALLSLQAFAAIVNEPKYRNLKLLLIGRKTPYLNEIKKEAEMMGVKDKLIVRSDIPFTDLPDVVRGAEATLYPSRYEGFGLPVLEAISCGTPVLSATGSCLEEAGGEGALYVHPDDTRAAAEALRSILSSAELRAQLRENGLRHAAQFTSERFTSQIHNLYERLIKEQL